MDTTKTQPEKVAALGKFQREGPPGGTDSQRPLDREKLESRLAYDKENLRQVEARLIEFGSKLEVEDDPQKRIALRQKRSEFSKRKEDLISEIEFTTNQLNRLAEETRKKDAADAVVERTRIAVEGRRVGDTIRDHLDQLAVLYNEWRGLQTAERQAKNMVISLASGDLLRTPEFSYVTGVDAGLEAAITTVLAESSRTTTILARREEALKPKPSVPPPTTIP